MSLQRVEISDIINPKEGYKSMSIPSTIHSYAVCIEYLRKWFLSKFDPGFFGENNENFHVGGSHAFDDFRKSAIASNKAAPKEKLLRELRLSGSMNCQVNLDNDRNTVDMYPFGTEIYLRRHSTVESAFFKDLDSNLNLSQDFELLEMQANFKLTFNTRAQQLDMYKYCKMRFRVGATQGEYIDYDQHVPYNLMRQIAIDAGFKVDNGRIVDIISFLKSLNMNSIIPFLYKFRNINGQDEFFVRVKNAYVHISIPEMEFDDGDREGQATTDYHVTFTATVRFPATKCYIYYSENKHTQITLKEPVECAACFTTIRMIDAPEYNEKQWKKMFSTEYEDEFVSDEKTIIDLSSLLLIGDLGRVIKSTRDAYLSPSLFMDIKFFNAGELVPFEIDWGTIKCMSYTPLKSKRTSIVVYIDMSYVNSQILALDEIKKRGRL